MLLKIYGIKNGNWILKSEYIKVDDYDERSFERFENFEKEVEIKISVGMNRIKVLMISDETESSEENSLLSAVSWKKKQISYQYENKSHSEKLNHKGIGLICLKEKKIEYFNAYPRLSKGTIEQKTE